MRRGIRGSADVELRLRRRPLPPGRFASAAAVIPAARGRDLRSNGSIPVGSELRPTSRELREGVPSARA